MFMGSCFRLLATLLFALSLGLAMPLDSQAAAPRPNVLLILVDDLGFSDLGCYGSEIATPHLDQLAKNGLRFTQFYNTGRCWPTRGALLTGYYAQQIRRDTLPNIPSGGGGRRPAWAKLLPHFLSAAGYRSYHSGKWHIDGMPVDNGFDRSYYLKDQGRFFNPETHWQDDVKLPEVEKHSGYYGTTAIADHALAVLKEHAAHFSDRPFFHYLAFTAPHFPLHALPEDIARYEGRYSEGWAVIRNERWERQHRLGFALGDLSVVERKLGPPYHFPKHLEILGGREVNRPVSWSELSAEQRSFQSTKMAIHAAMVDRVDQEIGRVLEQIREMGELENTLILFLSDNGASAEIMVRSDGHDPTAAMGSAASYLCLGPGWSTACNTPFRRHKTWTHEGGIATPLIVSWPRGIRERGAFRSTPGHVIDIAPTILELAGVRKPATLDGLDVPRAPGRSLLPEFAEGGSVRRNEEIWWFHDGHRALRMGDWKLVAAKGEEWELYYLGSDRAESNDLSQVHPDRVSSMKDRWNQRLEEFQEVASLDFSPGERSSR